MWLFVFQISMADICLVPQVYNAERCVIRHIAAFYTFLIIHPLFPILTFHYLFFFHFLNLTAVFIFDLTLFTIVAHNQKSHYFFCFVKPPSSLQLSVLIAVFSHIWFSHIEQPYIVTQTCPLLISTGSKWTWTSIRLSKSWIRPYLRLKLSKWATHLANQTRLLICMHRTTYWFQR